ncbi:MAG: major capsid protein [Roseburia sp.]|nr:major capsid protein [Roseburia sp.]
MDPVLNLFDTYVLQAIVEEIVATPTFFKDRYFPTEDGDIFAADKVLAEYKRGDRKMAPIVSPRAGDIPMDRMGYEVSEYQPAFIAPSRVLTMDDLKKRGFGEALYANSTPAQRAARLILQDQTDLDKAIRRREEWMCAETMVNNACTMQEYLDDTTKGQKLYVKFFNGSSDHIFTTSKKWDAANITYMDVRSDVRAMCKELTHRSLPAVDLVMGVDVADALLAIKELRELLDKNSGISVGSIMEELSAYEGVSFMGRLNFGGYNLNLISVDETYVDDSGNDTPYFPATAVMVTAPRCGRLKYGQITQIDYGSSDPATHTGIRIPKLVVDQDKDIRKLRLGARPLAVPSNYCPYIVATGVVG